MNYFSGVKISFCITKFIKYILYLSQITTYNTYIKKDLLNLWALFNKSFFIISIQTYLELLKKFFSLLNLTFLHLHCLSNNISIFNIHFQVMPFIPFTTLTLTNSSTTSRITIANFHNLLKLKYQM